MAPGTARFDDRLALLPRLERRAQASIEMKHRNISAVLNERGLRYIAGYKPLSNYPQAVAIEVERRLGLEPPPSPTRSGGLPSSSARAEPPGQDQ